MLRNKPLSDSSYFTGFTPKFKRVLFKLKRILTLLKLNKKLFNLGVKCVKYRESSICPNNTSHCLACKEMIGELVCLAFGTGGLSPKAGGMGEGTGVK